MMIFFLSEIYDDRLRRIFGFLFTWALSRQVCTVLQEAQRTLGWAVQCTLGLGPNVAKGKKCIWCSFGVKRSSRQKKKNAHSVRRLMTDKTFTASIIVGYKNYCGLVGYKKIEY